MQQQKGQDERQYPSTADWYFLYQVSMTKLLSTEMLYIGNGKTVQCFADKFNILTLHIFYNQNFCFCKVMQWQVSNSITQDTLLDQQHIAPCSSYLLDYSKNIVALLLKNPIHLSNHMAIKLQLRRKEYNWKNQPLTIWERKILRNSMKQIPPLVWQQTWV